MIETRRTGEVLSDILNDVVSRSPHIESAMVVSPDGLVIASSNSATGKQDKDLVGAVAASLLSASGQAITRLERGDFDRLLIQSTSGDLIITSVGPQAIFVLLITSGAKPGIIFWLVHRAAQKITEILEGRGQSRGNDSLLSPR